MVTTLPDVYLPETVGRLVTPGSIQQSSWLVDGLISDRGLSAIAITDAGLRARFGIESVLRLMQGVGEISSRRVVRQITKPLVLATSRKAAERYAAALPSAPVYVLQPWQPGDQTYWPALHELAANHDLVVVDHVLGICNGSPTWELARAIEEFSCPVLGLYVGNTTQAGIGGEVGWALAERKVWHNSRNGEFVAVDEGERAWPAMLDQLPDSAWASLPISAEQVHALAGRVAHLDGRRTIEQCADDLVYGDAHAVTVICGRPVTKAAEIVTAAKVHTESWERGRKRLSFAPAECPDEPPF